MATPDIRSARLATQVAAGIGALLAGLPGGAVFAQSIQVTPSIAATLSHSDNPLFVAEEQARGDTQLSISPRLSIRRTGPRLRLTGEAGLDATSHTNSDLRNRVTPTVSGTLNAEIIDNWFFLDSSVRVSSIEVDPFAPRAEASSDRNSRRVMTGTFSPYIDYRLGSNFAVRARSDMTGTRIGTADDDSSTEPSRTLLSARNTLVVERLPRPLGATLEATSENSRYTNEAEPLLRDDSVRASVSYSLAGDTTVSIVAGRERSRFTGNQESTDSIRGLRFAWRPNERTRLDADVERRFFGNGYSLQVSHRMPWLTSSLSLRRAPVSNPFSLQFGGGGATLGSFLDSILTTRYPDPAERNRIVADILASRGLPASLSSPIGIVSRYAQLENGGTLSFVLLGARNTFTMSVYGTTQRRLQREDDPLTAGSGADSDSRQYGGSLGFNRRLSPQWTLDLQTEWSRVEALAARAGDETTQRRVRSAVTYAVSPRTDANAGLSFRSIGSTLSTTSTTREASGFVGILHRF